MRIKEHRQDDIVILTLSGNMMNDPTTQKLHLYVKNLIDNDQKKVVIDLGKVKWFYSTGLGALLASYTSLKNAGGDLRIARPSRKILSVFMVTEINKIFSHFDSVEEAVQSYSIN